MNDITIPYFHSVTLDPDKCVGCTTCIKQCPSEAIRVRKGKAHIIAEKCIDCGECIRVCPHGAKKAVSDSLSAISAFRWKVAIPAPALYSQFEESISVDRILNGLLSLGFDEVFEVAEAAEIVTGATKDLLSMPEESEGVPQRPVISTACPAVVKLVQVRYPSLIPHLAPLIPPMEVAARCVKERLHAGEDGVGVFFISPCAGKVTAARAPLGYKKSYVDGVIGLKDIYLPLRNAVGKGLPEKPLSHAGPAGMGWANSEGEVDALGERRSIAVDGIANVIGVLEAIENGKLKGVAYVEALACPAGCVGGPLTVENPYIARARLGNRTISLIPTAGTRSIEPLADLFWDEPVQARSARLLDPDMLKAMVMLEEIEHLTGLLPGLDCGSCGAPSCQALAEDIVRGNAVETDCIFKLRETVRELAGRLLALEELKPPGLDKE